MKALKPFLALFALTLTLSSCDIEKIIDENFEEKSLVVVAPDFIKNRVAVVLKDSETNQTIQEELIVLVYSNKKIIDLSGNYKNEFKVKGGLVEFALDPNEKVSRQSPLELQIISLDNSGLYDVAYKSSKILEEGFHSILLNNTKDVLKFSQDKNRFKSNRKLVYGQDFYLTFNNLTQASYNTTVTNSQWFERPDYYTEFMINGIMIKAKRELEEDITIRLKFNDPQIENTFKLSSLSINYTIFNEELNKPIKYLYIVNDKNIAFLTDISLERLFFNPVFNKINLTLDGFKIPKSSKDVRIQLNYVENPIGVRALDEPYRLVWISPPEIPDTVKTDTPDKTIIGEPALEFKIIVEDNLVSSEGYVNINKLSNIVNIGAKYKSLVSNKIVFAPHSRFDIEPQEIDLGGEQDCCGISEFKLKPKEGLVKYKLNLQFQCEGDNFATAPSVTAFLKESQSNGVRDLVSFDNGGATLYLKPGTQYEVNGNFNGDDFNFSFTNDQASIDKAVNASLSKNSKIKDVKYNFSLQNGFLVVINAKVIFKKGECPL